MARVVIPRRDKFHELWFTVFREGRLQSGVEALSKGHSVLLIVELGVLEPRWRESKAGGRRWEMDSSLPSPYAWALEVTTSDAPWQKADFLVSPVG